MNRINHPYNYIPTTCYHQHYLSIYLSISKTQMRGPSNESDPRTNERRATIRSEANTDGEDDTPPHLTSTPKNSNDILIRLTANLSTVGSENKGKDGEPTRDLGVGAEWSGRSEVTRHDNYLMLFMSASIVYYSTVQGYHPDY